MAITETTPARSPAAPVSVAHPAAAAQTWGNSAPLALAGFALTTFLLSMINAGFVSKGIEPVVIAMALTFGGLTQLIAGILQFRTGNTFGGVLFTGFGAFWLSLWAVVQFFIADVPKAEVGHALGLYLISWGLFSTWMWLASFRTNVVVVLALGVLSATFFTLGAGNWSGSASVVHLGGYLGLIVAALAAYLSFVEVGEASYGRMILPLGPLAKR